MKRARDVTEKINLATDLIEEIKSKNRIGTAIELLRALAKELNECADEWERLGTMETEPGE
jgi:hypothetical protein